MCRTERHERKSLSLCASQSNLNPPDTMAFKSKVLQTHTKENVELKPHLNSSGLYKSQDKGSVAPDSLRLLVKNLAQIIRSQIPKALSQNKWVSHLQTPKLNGTQGKHRIILNRNSALLRFRFRVQLFNPTVID